MRGNNVMEGYFDDPEGTEKAFRGGWLHSGDLGVQHSDGYVELRDRAKDIIISGGENISTVEIEHAIERIPRCRGRRHRHPRREVGRATEGLRPARQGPRSTRPS